MVGANSPCTAAGRKAITEHNSASSPSHGMRTSAVAQGLPVALVRSTGSRTKVPEASTFSI
jgi:hypothetical protein